VRVFSTGNCTRIAELRRGVDPATIFSIAISPLNTLLAVTSDKSTLHVFDLPQPAQVRNDSNRVQSPVASLGPPTPTEDGANQKWGILGKIPLMPRVFSDIYSFASAHFEIGDESQPNASLLPLGASGAMGSKGVIGWSDERTILVIGSGRDGRWERFRIIDGDEGKRSCVRDGWKRFLGG
jgi:WD repeat-containing protein 45